MTTESTVNKIKELLKIKAINKPNPTNGEEAITIKETRMGKSYNVSIGIGKIVAINPRYFETQGYVWNEQFNHYEDGNIKIEPKTILTMKGVSYITAVFPNGLIRKVDEAKWDNKLKTLEDLIAILETV